MQSGMLWEKYYKEDTLELSNNTIITITSTLWAY